MDKCPKCGEQIDGLVCESIQEMGGNLCKRIAELEAEKQKDQAGLVQLRLTASELLEENTRLRELVGKAVSFGWDCGHYGKPCDSDEFLRANGLGEG